MKVLFVAPTAPWPLRSGGAIRTFNLVKAARSSVEIHLRAVRQPELDAQAALVALQPMCASVELFERARPGPWMSLARCKRERWFHSPALIERVAADVANGGFDLVHLDEMCLARILPNDLHVPAIVHHHKLDVELAEALAHGPRDKFDLKKLRALEDFAAARFPHHVACSDEDARKLVARYPRLSCAVVPSGVDPEHYKPAPFSMSREDDRLLFVGTLSYGPNLDALAWFAAEILPRIKSQRPHAFLEVIGSDLGDEARALASPHVRIQGTVADVRPALERAACLVVPLRIGGGTRLKIVEALAMECPVVSTRIGAEGLALAHGEHLLLADDADAFALAVLRSMSNPTDAREMARRGREKVVREYSWGVLVGKLIDAWHAASTSMHRTQRA